jgi:hypothetical protein
MRKRARSVHRKRLAAVLGDRDAVALALPGLVSGLLAIGLVLYGTSALRAQAPVDHVAPVATSTIVSGTSAVGSRGRS